jgi:C-terminal processing protease CtpA/Prc
MPPTLHGGLQEASAWLAKPTINGPEATRELPIAKRYADNALPDSEHRMLALFRIWGTIKYFDPYQKLITDWDGALRVALRDVQDVETSLQYAMTITKLYAHINDSHGFIRAPGFVKAFALPMPFVAQDIQGELTIVRVDPTLARRDGYNVGDVIKTIDGETTASRATRLLPYIPASTKQAANEALDLDYGRTPSLLAGPVGSTAVLGLEGPGGHLRDVRIRRQYASLKIYARTRPAVDILPGNVGYVDLPRLTAQQVDPALDRVGRARAIIFDLRGYPPPNFYELASHFTRVQVRTALFCFPVVHAPFDGDEDYLPESRDLYQSVAPAAPLYVTPVVVLINAMAISRAEHTALFLKAAANATFVGQPTEGADGTAVTIFVPGAITLNFTSYGVEWPNGTRLQGVGIIPDIQVAPTRAGILAGDDEILFAGLREALVRSRGTEATITLALNKEQQLERDSAVQGRP